MSRRAFGAGLIGAGLIGTAGIAAEPPRESYGNDGSGSFPPGTIFLGPKDEIYKTVKTSQPGATVGLRPGSYDFRDFGDINRGTGAGVTIQGQPGVSVIGIGLNRVVGLHWKHLDCVTTRNADFPSFKGILYAQSCNSCSFDHITCRGTPDATSRPRAAQIRQSTNIAITNCDFYQVGGGVNFVGTDAVNGTHGITYANNRMRRFIENGLLALSINDLDIRDNLFWHLDIDTGGHDDACQLTDCGSPSQATLLDPKTNRNWSVRVARNNFQALATDKTETGGNASVQGVVFSQGCRSMLSRENASFGCSDNGGAYENCNDVLIDQNFYQSSRDRPGVPKGTITIRNGADNVTATNNQCTGFGFSVSGDAPNGPKITVPMSGPGANTIIPNAKSYLDTALRDAFVATHGLPHGFSI